MKKVVVHFEFWDDDVPDDEEIQDILDAAAQALAADRLSWSKRVVTE